LLKFLFVLLLLTGTVAAAGTGSAQDTTTAEVLYPELTAMAAEKGQVAVLARLKLSQGAWSPEGNLTAASVGEQRQAITAARDALLGNLAEYNVEILAELETVPWVALRVDAVALEQLAKSPYVITLQEDRVYKPNLASATAHIGADATWGAGFGGAGQTVAILDTGIDADHPFFGTRVVWESCYSSGGAGEESLCPDGSEEQHGPGSADALTDQCWSNGDGTGIQFCSHGTHVAGIAAGRDPDPFTTPPDYNGVAPEANVIAIQVFTRFDDCSSDPGDQPCIGAWDHDIQEAVEYIQLQLQPMFGNIVAANLSLGGDRYDAPDYCDGEALKTVIDNLRSLGTATVISSGNDDWTDAVGFPGCISSAITVGNVYDPSDNITDNMHPVIDVLGAGRDVDSSVPDDRYDDKSGTSMAAPQVTGAFAMLKAIDPSLTVAQIETLLETTGVPVTDQRPPCPDGTADPGNPDYACTYTGFTKPRIQLDAAVAEITTADLRVIKDCKPDEPMLIGETGTCTIYVDNLGPDPAMDVSTVDAFVSDGDFNFGAITTSSGTCSAAAGTIDCDLGGMQPGARVTIEIDVVGNEAQNINDTVTVSSMTPDPDPYNNQASDELNIVEPSADLRVSKTCLPPNVLVGGEAVCTITVENLGPQAAMNVEILDDYLSSGTFEFGPGAVWSSAGICSSTPNPQVLGGVVECDVGHLDPGGVVTIKVPLTAATPQVIEDRVTVTSDTPDPDHSNNWAEDALTFGEMADLRVFKDCKPDPPNTVWAGAAASCTIRVRNWGPSTAHAVYLVDHYVADGTFEFVDVATTGAVTCSWPTGPQDYAADVTCDVGNMDPGAEETIVVTFSANEGMDINDTATASSLTYDPDFDNNSASDGVTVRPHADLALTKTATPNPVIAGTQLTYDLSVTNSGPSTAVNVVVADVLPFGVAINAVTSPDGTCNAGEPGNAAMPTRCTVDTLAAGAIATMQIVVTVEPQILGTISNNAKVSSDVVDRNNSNNLAVVDVTVVAEAELGVTKSDFPDPVLAGNPLSYDVTITNYGPSTATAVQLVDHLPPDVVSFASYTVSNGSGTCALTEQPQGTFHLECDLNDLNPGQFVTVFIEVTVDSSVPHGTTICNNVEVWSETLDPNSHPNTAEECTLVNAEAELEMFKDALFDASNPSRTVVYFLDVINHGPSDAHDVYIIDRLPLTAKKVVYVFDNSNGVCWYDKGLHQVHCDVGTLPAYDSEYPERHKFRVDIYVDIRGSVDQIMNEVEVFSSTTDANPANNIAYKGLRIKGGVIKPPNSPKPR
jgi:uncharacterized repeat protein (TIGR01451 family)